MGGRKGESELPGLGGWGRTVGRTSGRLLEFEKEVGGGVPFWSVPSEFVAADLGGVRTASLQLPRAQASFRKGSAARRKGAS